MIGRRLLAANAPLLGITMRSFGRALQVLGLAVPPLGMVLQLSDAITLGQMLTMLVAAACMFGIGRIVEGYAR
jgi:hypothetical protein